MRSGLIALLSTASVLTSTSTRLPTALVWYDSGHRLVARIAVLRLTPHTAEAIKDILGGQSLPDASTWADEIKMQRPDTKPLHYVNIPLNATDYVPSQYCPDGRCLIAAIEDDRRILGDSTAKTAQRAEALRFLVHFMGDLHQPLHVSNNRDEGGNNRMVTFFGATRKLHEVWDGELMEATTLSEDQYFERLRRKMDSLDLAALERGTVVDWAMEGHKIAAQHAYLLPRNGRLSEAYEEANLPLVDLALIEAGVRLARVLNDALVAYRPSRAAGPALPPGTYTDREAAAHVGESATIVGIVVTVHRTSGGNVYLNFGAAYPHQTFSGAVLDPRDPKLEHLEGLAGKRVAVKGVIQLYKGQPEIVIERADQIAVVE
jgi:hypothetical protein